jgi:hypothetical protein
MALLLFNWDHVTQRQTVSYPNTACAFKSAPDGTQPIEIDLAAATQPRVSLPIDLRNGWRFRTADVGDAPKLLHEGARQYDSTFAHVKHNRGVRGWSRLLTLLASISTKAT